MGQLVINANQIGIKLMESQKAGGLKRYYMQVKDHLSKISCKNYGNLLSI